MGRQSMNMLHHRIQSEALELQMLCHAFNISDFNELDVKLAVEGKIHVIAKLLAQIKEGE